MHLDPETTRHLLRQMILIRRFEDRSAEMYTKSNIRGFLHLYSGEEAVAVGVMNTLTTEDAILSTYREHGHALARGVDAGSIMSEMFGKQEGCSRGRGGSMHLFSKQHNFYGGNAIVAGHLPVAVGMALAAKKLHTNSIVCCFFGEGAAAEGEFHESMNLAALWQVPLLFVCENNRYAMGTALAFTHARMDIEAKAAAYCIDAEAVDGMDLMAVLEASTRATEKIRSTGRPFLLVCNTYRFRAHSMFDAELYRDKAEVLEWKKRDPITVFQQAAVSSGMIDGPAIKALEDSVDEELQRAVAFSEAGTWEPLDQLTKYTYAEGGRT